MDDNLIDYGFGGARPNRNYFELQYNPDTNDFVDFELNDFKKFLGALLVDKQTFIIRTEGMWDTSQHLEQYRGQVLFAFNFWTPRLRPEDIVGCRNPYVGPTTVNMPLLIVSGEYDGAYEELSRIWESFILQADLYLLPHTSEINFINSLDSVSFLNSISSSIGQFGNPNRFEI